VKQIPREKTTGKSALRRVLLALCAAGLCVSLAYIAYYVSGSVRQRALDRAVQEKYAPPAPVAVSEPGAIGRIDGASLAEGTDAGETDPPVNTIVVADNGEEREGEPAEPSNYERLRPLLEMNGEFVAYLTIPGFGLEQPVVQAGDNVKYLTTGFDGSGNKHGTVFLDCGNERDFTDGNSVLYGHAMYDGTMFNGLSKYKNIDTYMRAPLIKVDSVYGETTDWLIFAVYSSEPDFVYYTSHSWGSGFGTLLDEVKKRSMYITDIDVNEGDRILTLVTCDYVFEDARFVVHARLLRENEAVPEVFSAVMNPRRNDYKIPNQQRLTSVACANIAVWQNPQTLFMYYFQRNGRGIGRYAGDLKNVQGPYQAYKGEISDARFSWLAAGSAHPAKAEYYIVSGGLNGDSPGLYLLKSSWVTDSFVLTSKTPISPAGVDARWPVLYTDAGGAVTVLYTVLDAYSLTEILFSVPLGGGEPKRIASADLGADMRPVGIVRHGGLGTLVAWKEGSVLHAALEAEDGDYIDLEVRYGPQKGRTQILFDKAAQKWLIVNEANGKLSINGLDVASTFARVPAAGPNARYEPADNAGSAEPHE